MTAVTLILFSATILAGALVPGPAILTLLTRVVTKGFRATVPFMLGLMLMDLLWLAGAAFGLHAAARVAGTATAYFLAALRYVGAAYLAYLALRFWRAAPPAPRAGAESEAGSGASERGGVWATFWGGVILTASNPKTMIFYLAVLPAVVDLHALTPQGFATLAVVLFTIDGLVMAGYGAAAHFTHRGVKAHLARRAARRQAAINAATEESREASRDASRDSGFASRALSKGSGLVLAAAAAWLVLRG